MYLGAGKEAICLRVIHNNVYARRKVEIVGSSSLAKGKIKSRKIGLP